MKTAIRIALAFVVVLGFSSSYTSRQAQQSGTKLVTILSLIDGSDVLKIRGNELWFEHRNFVLPGKWTDHADDSGNEPTYINTESWAPKWNGGVSVPYTAKSRLLPQGSQFEARLVTPQDRGGSVTILEQPSSQNNFTLSILLDDDFAPGAAWYQVELRLR